MALSLSQNHCPVEEIKKATSGEGGDSCCGRVWQQSGSGGRLRKQVCSHPFMERPTPASHILTSCLQPPIHPALREPAFSMPSDHACPFLSPCKFRRLQLTHMCYSYQPENAGCPALRCPLFFLTDVCMETLSFRKQLAAVCSWAQSASGHSQTWDKSKDSHLPVHF